MLSGQLILLFHGLPPFRRLATVRSVVAPSGKDETCRGITLPLRFKSSHHSLMVEISRAVGCRYYNDLAVWTVMQSTAKTGPDFFRVYPERKLFRHKALIRPPPPMRVSTRSHVVDQRPCALAYECLVNTVYAERVHVFHSFWQRLIEPKKLAEQRLRRLAVVSSHKRPYRLPSCECLPKGVRTVGCRYADLSWLQNNDRLDLW